MTRRRLAPCLEPGCHELTYAKRCPAHTTHPIIVGRPVYLSRRWKGIRRTVLREHPWCACDPNCCPDGCKDMATEVDHIVSIANGGDPWDPTNLQALSRRCHSRKTAREVWHGA